MNWKRDKATRHWHAEEDGHKIRIQQSTWGNSRQLAWEIFIDGKPHGKELNVGHAKAEAKRCLATLVTQETERANF